MKKIVPRSSDRNLLFGIMALQMDFITRDGLIDALRDWTTQKDKPLGEILVERGDLAAGRRDLLEPLVDEHVRQHGDDPAESLAFVSSFVDASVDWHRVHDVGIAESLASRRLTRNTHALSTPDGSGRIAPKGGATRYRVLRPHAEGGLGCVLVAQDEELHREVALKEIKPQFSRDFSSRSRFTLEAEITGGLEHPGIVPVYGLGQYSDGRPYYAMRFIRGDSLKEAIEQFYATASPKSASVRVSPEKVEESTFISESETIIKEATAEPTGLKVLPREAFASVEFRKLLGRFIDVCHAIEYAHSRGVLHRDLKPGNIMLGKYGETLVVDWGLAKAAGKDDRFANVDEATLVPSSSSSIENTADGSVIGTPAYMSPEQAAGRLEQLGPATDVYSLGATLYHLLTGQPPFAKCLLQELLKGVQSGEFPRPHQINSKIPKALEAICLKAMALRPSDRYESAAAIAEDIEHWLGDEPVTALRDTLIVCVSRWVKKHRAWAISGIASLAIIAAVATIAAFYINGQKEIIAEKERDARRLSNENRTLAIEKTELANKEKVEREIAVQNAEKAIRQTTLAQRNLYIAHMNLAQAAWDAKNVKEASRLLEQYRTPPDSQGGVEDFRGFEWYYLDRVCHEELLTIKTKTSKNIKFSPDGKRFATSDLVHTITIWDAITGKEVASFRPTSQPERYNTVGFAVHQLSYSPDGGRLASAGADHMVRVWDLQTGTEALVLEGHRNHVLSVTFSPDGTKVASTSLDGTVKIWDLRDGNELLSLKGMDNFIGSNAEWSKDNIHLAVSAPGESLKVIDTATGTVVVEFNAANFHFHNISFSPDCTRIANIFHGSLEVWDAKTGKKQLELPYGGDLVTFSPDGKWLAASGLESEMHSVVIFDSSTGARVRTIHGHSSSIDAFSFSPDGRHLASVDSTNDEVKVWDLAAPTAITESVEKEKEFNGVAFDATGKLVAGADKGNVLIWDALSLQRVSSLIRPLQSQLNLFRPEQRPAFSSNRRYLASVGDDAEAIVWDTTTSQIVRRLVGHEEGVNCAVFSPDGLQIATGSADRRVMLWDAASGQNVLTLSGHELGVSCIAYAPDGVHIVTVSDKTIRIWDRRNGQLVRKFVAEESIRSLAISPDGQTLATGYYHSAVKLWRFQTGDMISDTSGSLGLIESLAFTPDGRRLLCADSRGSIKVFDTRTSEHLITIRRTAGITSISISPDGFSLAAVGGSTVTLWNAKPLANRLHP